MRPPLQVREVEAMRSSRARYWVIVRGPAQQEAWRVRMEVSSVLVGERRMKDVVEVAVGMIG